jgi:hypothetical protein
MIIILEDYYNEPNSWLAVGARIGVVTFKCISPLIIVKTRDDT